MGGGHYVAYIYSDKLNNWYHFSDSGGSQVNEAVVLTQEAYILFYSSVENTI